MKTFDFFAPKTLEEATQILAEYREQARVLAGGTDLLLRLKRKQWTCEGIISLRNIAGLREISLNGEMRIGTLATLNDVIRSSVVRTHLPVLASTAATMAGVQVRNLATVGGNICNASPAADMAPPLIALNARAIAVSLQGEREIALDEFFVGPGRSALGPDEILKEIRVPLLSDKATASYMKLEHRQAMDIAIAGVSVWARIANGVCEDVRIVLGAVAPTPMHAGAAERILRGQVLDPERIRIAAYAVSMEADPIDDVRGSAWYRRKMVEVLTRRQLQEMRSEKI